MQPGGYARIRVSSAALNTKMFLQDVQPDREKIPSSGRGAIYESFLEGTTPPGAVSVDAEQLKPEEMLPREEAE